MKRINEIAEDFGLKVIYDAAHAFNTRLNGETILNKMISEEHIQMTQENGQIHYFYPY